MLGPMPAYGFYARNSRAITLNNIRLEVVTPDLRPALILDHVTDAAISGLSVAGNTGAESALRLIDTQQVLITAPRLLEPAKTYLQLEGSNSSGIIIDGGDLTKAAETLAVTNGANKSAVKIRS